jgi:Core-2/I-Branching enzyme
LKIAYLILAHKYPEQLVRLVQRLHHDDASFLVHIDRKADREMYKSVEQRLLSMPRVYFLPRFTCHWGEFGIVHATITGIQKAIERKIPFDYLIFLSGQDYPIKSNRQIAQSLKNREGKSLIDFHALPRELWRAQNGGFNRIDRYYFRLFDELQCYPAWSRLPGRRLRLVFWFLSLILPEKRQLPKPYRAYGGSAYWCLSAECVQYLYDLFRRDRKIVRFFKYTNVPDELFYQTILATSPLKDSLINDVLQYMQWEANSFHPTILRAKDFDAIAASPKLFARKFDATVDAEILDLIDQKLLKE